MSRPQLLGFGCFCLLLCCDLTGSAVFFPTSSAYGIFAAIAVPLDLPHRNVFISYNFEANYNLPATWSIPPVALNIEDEDFLEQARRMAPSGECANCTDSSELNNLSDDTTTPTTTLSPLQNVTSAEEEEQQQQQQQPKQRSGRRRKRRMHDSLLTRRHFYYILRDKFERSGYSGEPCLLRLICETNASGLGEINGVLGTLVHIIFSPSTSMSEQLPLTYYQAELDGVNSDCAHYATSCAQNPLDLISKTLDNIISTLSRLKLETSTTTANQLNNCCQFPAVHYQSYATKCAQAFSQSQPFELAPYIQPCVIACIFHQHDFIDADDNLQLARLRSALRDAIRDERFAAAYFNGFKACVPSIRAKLERRRKRDKTKQSQKSRQNCSDVPMLYAACAHTDVFVHCPAGAWQASRSCNATREFVRNCVQPTF